MVFEFNKKIYGFECDVYGHLNNANYLQVYEAARAEALVGMDLPIAKLLELGYMIFLIKIEIEYKKAVQLEDTVKVFTSIVEHNRMKAIWKQEIFDSKGNLCNTAIVTGVYTTDGKPTRIDKNTCEHFDRFVM